MPYIKDEFKNRLRQDVDIVSVINRDVPLVRAGNRYKARCPFHTEKTPSFMVNPSTNTYHCFGCGEHGDVITFVMKMRNMDFVSAVEYLCDIQGITPEYDNPSGYSREDQSRSYEERKKLFELLRETANYYFRNLQANKTALKYLTDRGLKTETIRKYGLGYSVDSFSGAYDYLTKEKGYEPELLEKAGIIRKSERGSFYDYFRNRIMFPIQDMNGRVIAFGGRIFNDERGPKYLNSPETRVFKKKSNLYNLNNAKKLFKDNPMILVEGYMDVISLVNNGIENACATLGTAFNIEHARLVNRFTQNVVIMYDSDSAGEKATVSASEIFESINIFPRVVRLPEGEDPDSYVLKYGKDSFDEMLKGAVDSIVFRISLLERDHNLMDSWQRADYVKKACRIIGQVRDSVRRELYIKDLSSKARVEISTIEKEIESGDFVRPQNIPAAETEKREEKKSTVPKNIRRSEFIVMKYIIDNIDDPEKIEELELDPDLFVDQDYLELYALAAESINEEKKLDILGIFDYNDNLGTTLSEIIASEISITRKDVFQAMRNLKVYRIEKRLAKVRKAINDIEESGENEDMLEALMTEFYRLQMLRNNVKNGGQS